jgi:DNA invertase Pin-like site-specific DNA recombinase
MRGSKRPAGAKTRAVGYVRVSLEKQAEGGVSLAEQRARLEAYARLYELDLVAVEVDAGVSARTLERPGLERALEQLRKGKAEALLVCKLDRLTRSVRDLGDLVERWFAPGRFALLSVAEQIDTRSAGGRLVLNVLASVAQWEREATGERTSAAMRHMAASGEYTGGEAPYGFALDADGHLEPVPAEQAVIDEATLLRAAGLSLREVAARLDARGMRSRAGRPFAPAQVARMVRRAGNSLAEAA